MNPRYLPAQIALCLVVAGCLNTQSVAFQEQPEAATSPRTACREAAQADGWTVLDVDGLDEVSEGYWEARVKVDDPELQDLVLCRHNTVEGWTEILVLDE
ncbi:MAG: hypothetical protein E4H28_03890 [Gemmatimonadales bacterium]|nr:MAG: hypothetical protein E4H28_03890 [Gemmatimonadales bacterium]